MREGSKEPWQSGADDSKRTLTRDQELCRWRELSRPRGQRSRDSLSESDWSMREGYLQSVWRSIPLLINAEPRPAHLGQTAFVGFSCKRGGCGYSQERPSLSSLLRILLQGAERSPRSEIPSRKLLELPQRAKALIPQRNEGSDGSGDE